jgi:hypothetical protein
MAPRRSAARSARLEGSALGDAGLGDADLDALAGATLSPGRPAAAFAPPRPLADFDLGPGRVSDMHEYMTDQSVIVNWSKGQRLSHRRYSEVSREWNIGRYREERIVRRSSTSEGESDEAIHQSRWQRRAWPLHKDPSYPATGSRLRRAR